MPENAYLPTPTIGEPKDWRHRAACRGKDTNWWFSNDDEKTEAALNTCASCPVKQQCLEDALTLPRQEDYGIRGGVRERARRNMRRVA